ncbi:MAG TPA: hypothetical protein VGY76_09455 [Solirubrobacteraceae bacterium]|jgi:hypothetical protein|nr:hypothetical protein [Solirubrobacteraceae bacterium]
MNRNHRRSRLAALAACAALLSALATLGFAGPAAATLACSKPGYASGDALQSIAQVEVFITSTGWGAHSSCSSAPASSWMTYSHTSAGQALDEFGNNSGELNAHEDKVAFESTTGTPKDAAGQVLDWFVGTGDPPTTVQLEEAKTASGASALNEITLPVAQASIAVLLSLPTGCKVQSGSAVDINNTTLGQLWEGTNAHSGEDPGGIQAQGGYAIGTWGALFHQLGYTKITSGTPGAGQVLDEGGEHGCGQALKPQVSSNLSGTAYDFKSYLNQINSHVWSTYASDAKTWPSSAVVESDPLASGEGSQSNDSEGHLSGNTAETPGSVGFAGVGAAMLAGHGGFTNSAASSTFGYGGHSAAHQILWAEVQNNGTGTEGATYADPLVPSTTAASCPTTHLLPSEEGYPSTATGSWHGIIASDPNTSADAGATNYSICALTYDLVWHQYSASKLYGKTETTHEIVNTVRDLFEYITGQGQTDVQSHGYMRFPSGFGSRVLLNVSEIKY